MGESFTDIGDANPTNCNAKVGKHLLRLASTRAIARALREFHKCRGLTALEELADLNDVMGNGEQKPRTVPKKKATPKTKASTPVKKSGSVNSGKPDISDNSKSKGNGAGEAEAKAPEKSPDSIHPKMSEAQIRQHGHDDCQENDRHDERDKTVSVEEFDDAGYRREAAIPANGLGWFLKVSMYL